MSLIKDMRNCLGRHFSEICYCVLLLLILLLLLLFSFVVVDIVAVDGVDDDDDHVAGDSSYIKNQEHVDSQKQYI